VRLPSTVDKNDVILLRTMGTREPGHQSLLKARKSLEDLALGQE
jgi:hypothetical protein